MRFAAANAASYDVVPPGQSAGSANGATGPRYCSVALVPKKTTQSVAAAAMASSKGHRR
jgi:hypothetical protein